jgi:hypothetical protein
MVIELPARELLPELALELELELPQAAASAGRPSAAPAPSAPRRITCRRVYPPAGLSVF